MQKREEPPRRLPAPPQNQVQGIDLALAYSTLIRAYVRTESEKPRQPNNGKQNKLEG